MQRQKLAVIKKQQKSTATVKGDLEKVPAKTTNCT